MPQKISCIVPVFNEAKRIGPVLDVLTKHPRNLPMISEVIVVNDGSTDNTESLLKNRKDIKLISYSKNQGKTHALKEGIKAAENDLVLLVDSDLEGLDADAIAALMLPVQNNTADISISLRKNALRIYLFFGLDFVSGERVFNRNILGNLDLLDGLPKFGFESYLNKIIIEKKLRLTVVSWPKVISPRKSVKEGWYSGIVSDYKMAAQIIKYLSLLGTLKLYLKLWSIRLLVK